MLLALICIWLLGVMIGGIVGWHRGDQIGWHDGWLAGQRRARCALCESHCTH